MNTFTRRDLAAALLAGVPAMPRALPDSQLGSLYARVKDVATPVAGSGVISQAGAPDRQRCHLFDVPHRFNENMQPDAWEWLKGWV